MGKKTFYLLAVLGAILLGMRFADAAQHLIVKKVRVNNESHKARLVFDMNQAHSFKVEEEDGIIKVTLPHNVEWQSHKSRTYTKGVIEKYTLKGNKLKIQLKDGGHLNSNFKLGPLHGSHRFVIDFILNTNFTPPSRKVEREVSESVRFPEKKESTSFIPPSMRWDSKKASLVSVTEKPVEEEIDQVQEQLKIKEIRLGVEGGRTRLVLETNNPIQFKAEKTLEEVKLYALSGARWPNTGALPYAQGAIHKLSLEREGAIQYLSLKIVPGTVIDWENLDTSDPNHPRYTLDLTVLPPPPHDHSLRPEDLALRPLSKESENAAEDKSAEEPPLEPVDPNTGVMEPLVKQVGIREDVKGTHLHLYLSAAQDFMVKRDGRRVWIELPKMNWDHIKTSNQSKGLIDSYLIDQSDPEKSYLVLNIKEGVVLTGEQIVHAMGKTPPQYILSMQTRQKIGPHWGLGIMPNAISAKA